MEHFHDKSAQQLCSMLDHTEQRRYLTTIHIQHMKLPLHGPDASTTGCVELTFLLPCSSRNGVVNLLFHLVEHRVRASGSPARSPKLLTIRCVACRAKHFSTRHARSRRSGAHAQLPHPSAPEVQTMSLHFR